MFGQVDLLIGLYGVGPCLPICSDRFVANYTIQEDESHRLDRTGLVRHTNRPTNQPTNRTNSHNDHQQKCFHSFVRTLIHQFTTKRSMNGTNVIFVGCEPVPSIQKKRKKERKTEAVNDQRNPLIQRPTRSIGQWHNSIHDTHYI